MFVENFHFFFVFFRVEYSDEAGNDPPPAETSEEAEGELNSTYIVPAFTTKNFRLEGVTFSTVEFPCKARTFSKSVMSQSQTSVNGGDKEKEDSYVALVKDRSDDANTSGESIEVLEEYRHVVLCGKLCGSQEVKKNYLTNSIFVIKFLCFSFLD